MHTSRFIYNHIIFSTITAFALSFFIGLYVSNKNNINHNNNILDNKSDNTQKLDSEVICNSSCDDNCMICFDKLGDDCYVLPCGHKFHKNCINPWIEECNKEVSEEVSVEITFPVTDTTGNTQDAVPGATYIERRQYSPGNEVYVYEIKENKITKPPTAPSCPTCRCPFQLSTLH